MKVKLKLQLNKKKKKIINSDRIFSHILTNKKGYLQIDFSFALLLFFIFFISIYSYFSFQLNSIDNDKMTLNLNSNSNDICKLLISSSGFDNNWESNLNNLQILGLNKIGENYLDPNKIIVLNSTNYGTIIHSLGINFNLNIKIINISNNFIFKNFGSESTIYSKEKSSSICYSNYNNTNPAKIIVEVWK